MPSASDRFCMIARLSTMSDRAVFFDPTHRRWWWVKRIGTLLGLFVVVTISAWLVSLFTAPLLPGMRGITVAIIRSLRRARFRSTRRAQASFSSKRDRDSCSPRSRRTNRRGLARRRKVRSRRRTGSGIVAAFYAPWQETGLHSLEANAQQMTHLLPAWVHLQADARTSIFTTGIRC